MGFKVNQTGHMLPHAILKLVFARKSLTRTHTFNRCKLGSGSTNVHDSFLFRAPVHRHRSKMQCTFQLLHSRRPTQTPSTPLRCSARRALMQFVLYAWACYILNDFRGSLHVTFTTQNSEKRKRREEKVKCTYSTIFSWKIIRTSRRSGAQLHIRAQLHI